MRNLGTMRGLLFAAMLTALLMLPLGRASAAPDIKIGVLTPLTAGATGLGQECERGAELGVAYVNAHGGVLGGRKFKLVTEDDAGQVEKAVAGYRKLVTQDGVVAVIGQVHSSNMLAINNISDKLGVPVFSTQAAAGGITSGHTMTAFRTAAIDDDRVVAWIGFIKQQGFKKIAMLGENTDYGVGLIQGVTDANKNEHLGLELKSYVFDKSVVDLTPQLLEIKNWNPDLVINIGVGNPAYLIINQAYDIQLFPEKPMLASYDFPTQPIFWKNLGSKGMYLLYIIYYHPNQKLTAIGNTAKKMYEEKYKDEPVFGSLNAFGQITILAAAINRAKSAKPAAIIKQLEKGKYTNFNGPASFPEAAGVRWHQASPSLMIAQATAVDQAAKDAPILYPAKLATGKLMAGHR
jgi:branched-chain amino acid transport system substrate-binding protein